VKNTQDNLTAGKILSLYLEELGQKSSLYTVKGYKRDIKYFFEWFSHIENPHPENITSIDLREYQSYLRSTKKQKPNSVNRKIKALKSFLKWCVEKNYAKRLPEFPPNIPQVQSSPKSLERAEVNRLLRELEKEGNLRDIALIRLMLSCGLRIAEAVSLRISDLEIRERSGKVTVRSGKGGKYREVPLPLEARKALIGWLEAHPGGEYLFPGKDGHITENAAWRVVKKYAYKAKIPDLTPHSLRHTCARNMIRAGVDLATVSSILGHSRLDTTAVYICPSFLDMEQALEKSEL